MIKTAISNSDDVIDSRDVIERIAELESAMEDAQEDEDAAKEVMEDGQEVFLSDDFTEDEYQELCVLKALQEEAEGYCPDWRYGASLIRDSHFKEYAQQFADDIEAIDRNVTWPLDCIDWDQAADELKMDYTQVDFDGVAYWVR